MAEGLASGYKAYELSRRRPGCKWRHLSLVSQGRVYGGEWVVNEAVHGAELEAVKTRHITKET